MRNWKNDRYGFLFFIGESHENEWKMYGYKEIGFEFLWNYENGDSMIIGLNKLDIDCWYKLICLYLGERERMMNIYFESKRFLFQIL